MSKVFIAVSEAGGVKLNGKVMESRHHDMEVRPGKPCDIFRRHADATVYVCNVGPQDLSVDMNQQPYRTLKHGHFMRLYATDKTYRVYVSA